MKYLLAMTLAVVLVLAASPLSAGETKVGGVQVPNTLALDDATLMLNGAGERSMYLMQVYVGALYLPSRTGDAAAAILEQDEPRAVTMHITSDLINRDRMVDAIEEGFEAAMDGDISSIEPHIERLLDAFNDQVEAGDLVELIYIPGDGVTVRHNGERVGRVQGDATFTRALYAIWLGEDPIQPSLKEAMLGGK